MRRADAERLAEAHPFEDYPGIVVYWLDNPDQTVIPLASEEFLRSDLARAYLPPDELEAEEAAAAELPEPSHRPAPPAAPAPEPGTPAAHWAQLVAELAIEQGGAPNRWVHDTWVIDHDPSTDTYVIGLPDASRYDWIVNRLSPQIRRKLRVICGADVAVTFTVAAPDGRKPNPGSPAAAEGNA
jgi:hypothetical protein